MQPFFSTLAETTATLIALLLGAIAAYFVLLQGKSTEYDDKMQELRRSIQTEIATLQASWPDTMRMFLPLEFKERFSARSSNARGVQLVEKFAGEIVFPSTVTESALADVASDDTFGKEHWKGRVYAVALTEVVNVISGGSQLEPRAFGLGKPEERPGLGTAFPRSASGPGFGQWRNDFDRLSIACRVLEMRADEAISDFQAFLRSNPNLLPFGSLYPDGVRAIFDSIVKIRAHVRKIDELSLYTSRYSFPRRVHPRFLLVAILAALLIGVAVPLVLLTGLAGAPGWPSMIAILCFSSASTVAAFGRFGLDVIKSLEPDPRLYVSDRWLRPILEELDRNTSLLQSGSPLQLECLTDFLSSDDADQIPSRLRDELSGCRLSLEVYNSSAERLDAACLKHLEQDVEFDQFRRPFQESALVQHAVLHPSDLADLSKVQRLPLRTPGTDRILLGVETRYPWGSRGRMSLIAEPSKRNELADSIEALSRTLESSNQAREFNEKRPILLKFLPDIREQVAKFSRPVE